MWPCYSPVRLPQGRPRWNPNKPKPPRHLSINQTWHEIWEETCGQKDTGSRFYAVVFGSTLGTYWSNHPPTTAAQNTPCTFTVGPFWRSVKHTLPGALAAICVWVCLFQERLVVVYHSPHFMSGTVGTVAGNGAKSQPGDSLWSHTVCCLKNKPHTDRNMGLYAFKHTLRLFIRCVNIFIYHFSD